MRIEYEPQQPSGEGPAAPGVARLRFSEGPLAPGFRVPVGLSLGSSVDLLFGAPGRLVEVEFRNPDSVFGIPPDSEPKLLDVPIHAEREELFDELVIWFADVAPGPDEEYALTVRRDFPNGTIEFLLDDDGRLRRVDIYEATRCLAPEVIEAADEPNWLDHGGSLEETEVRWTAEQRKYAAALMQQWRNS